MDQTAAYQAAYPDSKPASAMSNSTRLMRNDKVAAEIAALRATAKEKAGSPVLTLAEKLDFLASIVRTPVGDLHPRSPLAQEWIEETSEFGSKTKVKMPCKLRALELHAKLSGELSDKVQVSADDDLKSALSAIVDSIRR